MQPKFAIVTPVKNEEGFFDKTLESVVNQTVKPTKWVVVNDGSTDGTKDLIERYAAQHDWIHPVHNPPRERRDPGGEGVIAQGIKHINVDDYDFFTRMDGDLEFEPNYFEDLFKRFSENKRLGVASGVCFLRENGREVEESHQRFHTRGPNKTYRKECFKDIGGLEPGLGWDTIDEVKANMCGWQSYSFPELRIIHLRPTQTAKGALNGMKNFGVASYYTGYHPLYLIARAMRRMFDRPYFFGGLSMLRGYFGELMRKAPQVNDPDLIAYVRTQQMNRLLGRESIWR